MKSIFQFKKTLPKTKLTMAALIICLTSLHAAAINNYALPKCFSGKQNGRSNDTTQKGNDATFLISAAEINLDEIMLGDQALQKSKMGDIKDFGEMLKEDHTNSLNELIALAGKKSIVIPTTSDSAAQSAYKKFQNASGADFDIEYPDMMVKGHKKAIALFEKEAKVSTDPDIRAWAIKTLPVLRKHLASAIVLQKKYQK
jgi:putative membrane protein